MPRNLPVNASQQYARDLTDRIRVATEGLYSLLLEAWESEAWRHLGYKSWNTYIEGEFDFSRQQAYRLVRQGEVVRALKAGVADLSPMGDTRDEFHITEREARDIHPVRAEVVREVRERVAAGESPRVAVQAAVQAHRKQSDVPSGAEHEHEYVCRICGERLH